MVYGTGRQLMDILANRLLQHRYQKNLRVLFRRRVKDLVFDNGRVCGCIVLDEQSGAESELRCGHVVIASGGITGNLALVRANWYKPWGDPPEIILNGSQKTADGNMHELVKTQGGNITHLDKIWNYAAGVNHPSPRHDFHGLSLIPPKNALWVNFEGRRIGMPPLITGYDTRYLVERICQQRHKYSWQILNFRTAIRELGVSGSEFNDILVNPKWYKLLMLKFCGNRQLVDFLVQHCRDFITANSLNELVAKMNSLNGDGRVNLDILKVEIESYDANVERGQALFNDDQIRRIQHLRQYSGDRSRTCKPSKIMDPDGFPLLAIREFIVTRKTLGGIQTDLQCKVLKMDGAPIPGLFAVGEAAGFGGGGIHGLRALEGTFLGSCIFTGRIVGKAIAEGA